MSIFSKWGFDAGREGREPTPRSDKAGPVESALFDVKDTDAKRGHDDYMRGYEAGAAQRIADALEDD